jgi:hypothetical protein
LFDTLQEEDPAEWTEPEIKEYIAIGNKFNSRQINYLLNHGSFTKTTEDPDESKDLIETPEDLAEIPEDLKETLPTLPTHHNTTGMQSFGKELANLAKMYTEDSKYSGENDNFDFKLIIFYNLYRRANVPKDEDIMANAYPTMLCGLALDHYYSNLDNIALTLSFNQICNAICLYFEGPKYKCRILAQWNSLTLKSVINKSKNTGKSTLDCLQLLIKELRHLQHGLDPDLRTDKFLHNKLINACQELPVCRYACYKPSDTLAGLINDLRSSITTIEKSQSENAHEAFYTDCCYHKQYPRPFNRNQPPPGQDISKKRCFVCNKEGCWSSKHSKEERDQSRQRFKEKLSQRFDRHAKQYIADHEGIHDDNPNSESDEAVDGKIETLIIDIESPPESPAHDQAELFLTSIGSIQQREATYTAINLADRSFTHAVTGTPILLL